MSRRVVLAEDEPILLTVKESQESLGVSRATFYRLVASGKIVPTTRRGGGRGRMFFDANDIHAYLLGTYHEPVPPDPEPEPEVAPEPPPSPAPVRRSRSAWQTGDLA